MTDSRTRVLPFSAGDAAGRWLDVHWRAAAEALSDSDLDMLLNEALKSIAGALDADGVSMLLVDQEGGLWCRAELGVENRPIGVGLDDERAAAVLASYRPLLSDAATPRDDPGPLSAYVGVPLRSGRATLGVLQATRLGAYGFGPDDVGLLLRFADPISIAVERVQFIEAERAARQSAEHAIVRLRGLQRITSAFASAMSVGEICRIIITEAVPGNGSHGEGAIWMLRDSRLVLVAGLGLSREYPEIPLDPSLPAAENLRDGTPLFVETRAELGARWPVLAEGPTAAFAGLPLIVDDRRLGVMAIGFREEHEFDLGEREYLAAVAEQAAAALARAESHAALREARGIADARLEQLRFLAHASEQLSGSLNLDVTLTTVAELGVPRVTDRCALFLVDGGAVSRWVLAPEVTEDERRLFEETDATLSAVSGVGAVLRTGQPTYVEQIDEMQLAASASSTEHLELLQRVGFGGLLIVPLRARGRTLGALAFVNRRGRPMPSSDRGLAEELAARAAVAIDNALLYRAESHVARRLTQALLPARLPRVPGVDIAVRYQAGSADLEVGGDFYDVIAPSDTEIVVLVGDVQGKGVEAASIAGVARHTVRACAQSDTSPAALLEKLNAAIIQHHEVGAEPSEPSGHGTRLCTAAIVRLVRDDDGWLASVCSAGHPLPLVRSPIGTVEAIGRHDLLLGLRPDPGYRDEIVKLGHRADLFMFTDGVSDRLESAGAEGPRLHESLRSAGSAAPEIADHLMSASLRMPSSHPDDMVALAVVLGI